MITRFEGEYRFLSNFYRSVIWFDGKPWDSVEHAYQACKTHDPEEKKKVQEARVPAAAKKIGQTVTKREDWPQVKVQIMRMLVSLKFLQSSDLRVWLLSTGEAVLVEGSYWHDNFWGNCTCTKCSGLEGQNHLGKTLMDVRKKLREINL